MNLSTLVTAAAFFLAVALVGCSNIPSNMPLVFGEDISIGINMGATATNQGGEVTLGFKSKDVAIIPVVTSASGVPSLIQSKIINKTASSAPAETTTQDAYSVLGQISTTTDGAGRKIGLGKFFATGQAATYLAQGFGKALAANAATTDSSFPAASSVAAASSAPTNK